MSKNKSHAAGNHEEAMALEDYLQPVAFVAKSLSDENRLRILLCVNDGKKSVSSIVEELNLSQPLVSHHLKELRRSLLVKVERQRPFCVLRNCRLQNSDDPGGVKRIGHRFVGCQDNLLIGGGDSSLCPEFKNA